jgi:hypothetical protein
VATLEDSGAAEGACLLAGGARAPTGEAAGGEPWAAVEVPIAATAGGEGGGTTGALMM